MIQTIHIRYPEDTVRLFALSDGRKQVLAIGDFDGVHLGHREVILRAVETARRLGIPATIMTFHPHPREVMGNSVYARLLTPLEEKQRQLEELGVDNLVIVRFDEAFMQVTAEQFVERVLKPMTLDTVIVGFDFRFGYRGSGTPDALCELAGGSFAVEVVRPCLHRGEKVSSTQIRQHLQAGEVAEAGTLLGRAYQVSGVVVSGDRRGRTIGFPTANIAVSGGYVIPANGVYAVTVALRGERFGGVANIGTKPTFTDSLAEPVLEAHLFDFDRSIYGETISVQFVQFIRGERKFDSVGALIDQIRLDAETARSLTDPLLRR